MDEKDIEHRLTEVEERSKSNTHRLNDLAELVSTVKVLAVREEAVENDVKEIKGDVKSLASKSGQRWDNMIDRVIWAIAAGLVAYAMAKIGII